LSESTVAIVGSGIVGTAFAYMLSTKGYDVEVFEKGPAYAYPHAGQFVEESSLYVNPAYSPPPDLQRVTRSGDYPRNLDDERHMREGGSATMWGATTPRMAPYDFNTRSRYGFGTDWPVTYREMEPYYCDAERLLGVSGTDADNPLAPWRSKPYPLPPFALSYDDRILAERLRRRGIALHTTPQARTRAAYEQRPGCRNFGTCWVCPIGARYSPNYHLQLALATGRCKLHTNTSVRRIVTDPSGRARALVYQPNDAATEREHGAKIIIVAAGTFEAVRLLLLSSRDRHPDGVRVGEQLGKDLMLHHAWLGQMHYKYDQRPGAVGPHTGLSYQFRDPATRGRHGGALVELSSAARLGPEELYGPASVEQETAFDIVGQLHEMRRWRVVTVQMETAPSAGKYITLSRERDRFGDPFAHVHYEAAAFDHESYRFARQVFDKLVAGTESDAGEFDSLEDYEADGHHMGGCRMGSDKRDGVVDTFGTVHDVPNLFVVGGCNFAGTSAVHPTLTMVALALRSADHIVNNVL
jgi:glucose dehydrogenase